MVEGLTVEAVPVVEALVVVSALAKAPMRTPTGMMTHSTRARPRTRRSRTDGARNRRASSRTFVGRRSRSLPLALMLPAPVDIEDRKSVV